MRKHFSRVDNLIINFDAALRTIFVKENRDLQRANPAHGTEEAQLSKKEQKHVAGLMRVNHSGEVCAQALYQGQALTAKLDDVKDKMTQAAIEEIDHLGWCEERLKELNSRTSQLNITWYLLSFTVGAVAGLCGDKWSLGFVVETEKQVTKHLESHIQQLPENDQKSLKILQQMVIDETAHATAALEAGGAELPLFIKLCMTAMSKIMTKTSYHI